MGEGGRTRPRQGRGGVPYPVFARLVAPLPHARDMGTLGSHLFGLEAERLFDWECERRGITCALPFSNQTSCDRVVVTKSGALAVQIKANRLLRLHRKGPCDVALVYEVDNHRRNGTKFGQDGVSVLAVYCAPDNRWHLFPAADIKGNRLRFGRNPTGRAKAAMDNWAILSL